MLETIREFAGERLEESGEADAVRGLHARFFVALADRRYADLRGGDAALWLQRFEDEHDNFRSSSRTCSSSGDSASALRLAGALSRFWMIRGHLSRGETLARDDAGAPRAWKRDAPRALRGLALIEMEQGDLDRAAAGCGRRLSSSIARAATRRGPR